MVILLLGAPGAGKGSISNILKDKYNFIHISTGEIFRKAINANTDFARKLKSIMLSGGLIDDDTTNEVVKNELMELSNKNLNIVLDGYPRNIHQANFLSKIVKVDYVFDILVDEQEIMKRITGRRTCPVCKSIYNIYYHKPLKEGVCDFDGSLLVQRNDDKEDVVIERFKTYLALNAPLVEYYKQQKIYYPIVNEDLNKAISEIKKIVC